MWKKIHSNRDPRDTLYSELKKEFKPWFGKAGAGFATATKNYPKVFFGLMILLMLVSAGLSFTVFRHHEKTAAVSPARHSDPVGEGFSQIMKATGQLRETLKLKHTVDSLSAKRQLSGADSLQLDSALDRLRLIHPNSK